MALFGKKEKEEKAQGKKEESETTDILVDESKKTSRSSLRLILIYALLLAAGLFIGIVFRLVAR